MIGTSTIAAAPAYATYAGAAPAYATYAAAAPQVTYAAPQVTYATETVAAPQVVETIAAPQVVETVAAPQVTYAAPQMTYAAPASYVAAPQVPSGIIVPPAPPVAPMRLTDGIPTPDQISKQKSGYAAALDKQLQEAISTVQKETQIEKDMAKFNADKNIAIYNNQVDEKLAEAVALADEQATIAGLELKKALVERNLQLSAQAQGLLMDYNMKSLMFECAQKRYAFDIENMKQQNVLEEQYAKQVAIANTGTSYAPTAAAVKK